MNRQMDFSKMDFTSFKSKLPHLQLGFDDWLIVTLWVFLAIGIVVALTSRGNRRSAAPTVRSASAFYVWGTGLRLLGIERGTTGDTYATTWLTVLYFPLLPLARHRIEFVEPRPGLESAWLRHESTGLVVMDVFATYLHGYVLFPALTSAPLLAGWAVTHLLPGQQSDDITLATLALFTMGIPWLIVSLSLIVRWDQKRKAPQVTSLANITGTYIPDIQLTL